VQETQCPKCGEWLGVPPEFADRPVKCGSCGRVIQPHERQPAPAPPPPPPSAGPRFPESDPPRSRGPRFPEKEFDDYPPPRRKGGGVWVWLLLGMGAFGFCCCGGVGFLFLAAANPKWEPYTADNGAFTADFPGKPEYKTNAFQWKDKDESPGTSHEYGAVQLMNAQGFAVHYTDLPKSMLTFRWSDEKLLKAGLEEYKRDSTNFTVKSSTETTVGKYKAVDVEGTTTHPQHGLLQVSVRVVIVGDRVFTLIAAGKERAKLTPAKDRFFNSFKPADPKDKGGEPKR
jgi:hypothetical protein